MTQRKPTEGRGKGETLFWGRFLSVPLRGVLPRETTYPLTFRKGCLPLQKRIVPSCFAGKLKKIKSGPLSRLMGKGKGGLSAFLQEAITSEQKKEGGARKKTHKHALKRGGREKKRKRSPVALLQSGGGVPRGNYLFHGEKDETKNSPWRSGGLSRGRTGIFSMRGREKKRTNSPSSEAITQKGGARNPSLP